MRALAKSVVGSVLGAALAASLGVGAASADGDFEGRAHRDTSYNWGGIYIGGSAGWLATGDIGGPLQFPAAPGNTFTADGNSGFAGGVHAGIQHQFGRWVLGVEGGMRHSFDGFSSTIGIGNAPPSGCSGAPTIACEARLGNIWQIGPRIGWAFDRVMVYGTGGYANAHIDHRAVDLPTGIRFAQGSHSHDGWFAGAGLEWAIRDNVILGVEYTHYEFDKALYTEGGVINSRYVSTNADSVVARLSFKLGRGEQAYEPLK